MAGTKNNRRTQYTIQALKEALLSLLQEKELAKITVTELCQRADINRGTFYLHFSDPLDLLKHVEADLMAQIRPVLAMRPQEQLHDWLQRFIYILKENADISRIVLNNYQDSRLIKEIFADVHDMALTEFTIIFDEQDPRLLEYYFTYFVKGTLGTLLDWLENDEQTSVEEITLVLTKLLLKTAS